MTDFHWEILGPDGMPLPGHADARFPTQADAEAWLGESWQDLADDGADAVTLMHHEGIVYGPMSLDPPS